MQNFVVPYRSFFGYIMYTNIKARVGVFAMISIGVISTIVFFALNNLAKIVKRFHKGNGLMTW